MIENADEEDGDHGRTDRQTEHPGKPVSSLELPQTVDAHMDQETKQDSRANQTDFHHR